MEKLTEFIMACLPAKVAKASSGDRFGTKKTTTVGQARMTAKSEATGSENAALVD